MCGQTGPRRAARASFIETAGAHALQGHPQAVRGQNGGRGQRPSCWKSLSDAVGDFGSGYGLGPAVAGRVVSSQPVHVLSRSSRRGPVSLPTPLGARLHSPIGQVALPCACALFYVGSPLGRVPSVARRGRHRCHLALDGEVCAHAHSRKRGEGCLMATEDLGAWLVL